MSQWLYSSIQFVVAVVVFSVCLRLVWNMSRMQLPEKRRAVIWISRIVLSVLLGLIALLALFVAIGSTPLLDYSMCLETDGGSQYCLASDVDRFTSSRGSNAEPD